MSWNWIYVSLLPPLYCCKMKISHTVFIILPFYSVSTCTSQIKECIIQSHKEWLAAPLLRLHLFKSTFMQQLGCDVISLYLSFSVHSVQQKSIGVIVRTSCSGSDVQHSCHHNSSRFSFPIFAHSWCFSVFHITISNTTYMLTEDNNTFA